MEITLPNNTPTITTEKKIVSLGETLTIDGLEITLPGEYEKSGVLVQSKLIDGVLVHELQVERKIV